MHVESVQILTIMRWEWQKQNKHWAVPDAPVVMRPQAYAQLAGNGRWWAIKDTEFLPH